MSVPVRDSSGRPTAGLTAMRVVCGLVAPRFLKLSVQNHKPEELS
ncbi:hypothetical protein ACFUN7_35105 [Streptomyces sp. NPDC057236]